MPNLPRKIADPYRELGVARGATDAEIKKAHRALAKRFHPDAAGGETARFVAIQEAYLLLSDPLRRGEWDARHAPGPVRANEPRRSPRPRSADGRWTREEGAPSATRHRGPNPRRTRPVESAHDADDGAGRARDAAWGGDERPAGTRSYRWSAQNVPWWEDFAPRNSAGAARGGKAGNARGPATGNGAREAASGPPQRPQAGSGQAASESPAGTGGTRGQATNEFDVYSRSSGAAWSSAARQYFRKASEDLPSRGSFVYRGTQVVTGATARKVAEDLLRQRPGVAGAPRQAFEARDAEADAAGPAQRQTRAAPRHNSSRSRESRETMPRQDASSASASTPRADGTVADRGVHGMTGASAAWARSDPDRADNARASARPDVVATAVVGGIGGLVVTLPLLALGMAVLDPPLQPAFAGLLLILAAIAGALAATVWMRIRNETQG